jgi:hypothetical protein
MTNVERRSSERRDAPARRPWEPMSVARIGTFGDILRGPSGTGSDANSKMDGKT